MSSKKENRREKPTVNGKEDRKYSSCGCIMRKESNRWMVSILCDKHKKKNRRKK